MVWREAYSTRVLDAALPALPPFRSYASDESVPVPKGAWVWLAGPDVNVQLNVGVWLRLLDSLERPPMRLISTWSGAPSRSSRSIWSAAIPRSQQPLWTYMDGNPLDVNAPIFAAAMIGGEAEILMLGSPTEDAWDAFQEALARAEARAR